MKPKALLARVQAGNRASIAFDDLLALAKALGFVHDRTHGSHRILRHPRAGTLPLQPAKDGTAKPYQVRQLMALVDAHALMVERGGR